MKNDITSYNKGLQGIDGVGESLPAYDPDLFSVYDPAKTAILLDDVRIVGFAAETKYTREGDKHIVHLHSVSSSFQNLTVGKRGNLKIIIVDSYRRSDLVIDIGTVEVERYVVDSIGPVAPIVKVIMKEV